MPITKLSPNPASFNFNKRKTSELLNKVKISNPITSLLYAIGLSFQYCKKEKKENATFCSDFSCSLSFKKKEASTAKIPGTNAMKNNVL